jgi:peptidoglycan-associated lipoprotein
LGKVARNTKENAMKMIQSSKLLGLGLTLIIAAAGCQTKPTPHTTILPTSSSGSNGALGNGEALNSSPSIDTTSGAPLTSPGAFDKYDRDAEAFKTDVVHFDYDSSIVKSDETTRISDVANHLKSNPASAVEVQGNCDERGTEEYNRALGERRALAVREALIGMGIDASKVVTMSFGKDKPASGDHDETAWKENRRDEFVLLTPPRVAP